MANNGKVYTVKDRTPLVIPKSLLSPAAVKALERYIRRYLVQYTIFDKEVCEHVGRKNKEAKASKRLGIHPYTENPNQLELLRERRNQ
jgi:hypothetical protein